MIKLHATVDLNAARYAIIKGDKEVYASAPGMLLTYRERHKQSSFIRRYLRGIGLPVNVQWVWCREYVSGRTETVWKITRR